MLAELISGINSRSWAQPSPKSLLRSISMGVFYDEMGSAVARGEVEYPVPTERTILIGDGADEPIPGRRLPGSSLESRPKRGFSSVTSQSRTILIFFVEDHQPPPRQKAKN